MVTPVLAVQEVARTEEATSGGSSGSGAAAKPASAEPADSEGCQGIARSKDKYCTDGTGDAGLGFYLQQVASLTTSAIGSSIITQCLEGLKVPSIAMFMGGSIVNIMAEIVEGKAKNARNRKNVEDMKLRDADILKKGDSSQLESLKSLLKEEQDTQKFLSNRKKWMIAVDAIYVGAAGMAALEALQRKALLASVGGPACEAPATGFAAAACAASAAAGPGAFASCMAIKKPMFHLTCVAAAEKAWAQAVASPKQSIARESGTAYCAGPYAASCLVTYNAMLAATYGNCKPAPIDGGAKMVSWPMALNIAYGFGSSLTTRDGGKVTQYGAQMLNLLMIAVPKASGLVEQTYNFPTPRIITFGALSGIAIGITTGLGNRERISGDNIQLLTKAINQFKVDTDGANAGLGLDEEKDLPEVGGAPSPANDPKTDPKTKRKYTVKAIEVTAPKNCLSDTGGKWEVSSQACASPIKISKPDVNNISIPVLKSLATLGTDMAQALANGDEAKATSISAEIGTMAAKVKAETAKLQAEFNKSLKADKQVPIDFDKKISEQVAAIQAQIGQGQVAGTTNDSSTGASAKPTETAPADGTPVTNVLAQPSIDPSDKEVTVGLDASEEAPAEDTVTSVGRSAQNLNDFEAAEEDISRKSESSLFKQVSGRYILNYSKIFPKKTLPTASEGQ